MGENKEYIISTWPPHCDNIVLLCASKYMECKHLCNFDVFAITAHSAVAHVLVTPTGCPSYELLQ